MALLHFNLSGSAADVQVSIDGPSPVEVIKKKDEGRVLTINYVPQSPGEYAISVKYKGKHIMGSPFSAKISGTNNTNFCHVILCNSNILFLLCYVSITEM